MEMKRWKIILTAIAAVIFSANTSRVAIAVQQKRTVPIPQTNSSYIDAAGTAHITRVVPVPPTISPEAQKFLARPIQDIPGRGSALNEWQDQNRAAQLAHTLYPVHVTQGTIAGVPVRIVTPLNMPEQNHDSVLINVHGGGFVGDGGSLTESIPIAYLTQTKVVAVLYRLMPKYPFPAAVNDTVAVYKELLKTHKPANMALYGTSAGATLTAEVSVKLRQLQIPLPGALGIFSGMGDMSTATTADSRSLFSMDGLSGHLPTPPSNAGYRAYMGSTNPKDPVLSPLYADLHGYPPTLFIAGERDMLLSGTTILHRAFLRAGVDARLIVFEGLPHAFWYDPYLPESKEADGDMASFFEKELHLAGRHVQ